jgi:hypothetical protein
MTIKKQKWFYACRKREGVALIARHHLHPATVLVEDREKT